MSPPSSFPRRFRTVFSEQFRLFLLALSFLSRLAPARRADGAQISASVFYYPLAGLCIGFAAALPVLAGLFSGFPLVQAWLYVLLSAWLTRALHLDGLSDLLDAVGSCKRGEDFRAVLKDSRMGALGAAGVVLALAGQIILVAAVLESGRCAPLLFAPLYARCLPIFLSVKASPYSDTGLGALINAAPRRPCLLFACLAAASGLVLSGPLGLALTLLLTLPLLHFLITVAGREGGYNGDFFGFAIVCGELAALLGSLA